ncbi:MAG: hemerythrin domain-containing protein [Deltaproteobacteria bacterium]|nr:hemerythrin domain-containing protein [Deltaproteobacteria bacterium]
MNGANRDFLEGLKKEHQAAAGLLEEVQRAFQQNQLSKTAQSLSALKGALLGHLKKEDEKLYPELSKLAQEKDLGLIKTTLSTFSTAMKGISERLIRFFDKYQGSEEIARDSATFKTDLTMVVESLHKRIDGEEKVLYPMYEKHCC